MRLVAVEEHDPCPTDQAFEVDEVEALPGRDTGRLSGTLHGAGG
jgi:hypothetical protein